MKKIISATLVMLGFILGATALSALAGTWTAPTCDPSTNPGACNVDAPINAGSSLQQKLGALWLRSGLAIDGNLVISTSTNASTAGKVLTSVDNLGTVGWRIPTTADRTAFCNSASAPTGGYAIISLIKNGVNMCTDEGGCTIKLTEINPSVGPRTSMVTYHQLASTVVAGSLTVPAGSWGAGNNTAKNGDSTANPIIGILNGGVIDDKTGIEETADAIVLGEGTVASVYRAEVCDF